MYIWMLRRWSSGPLLLLACRPPSPLTYRTSMLHHVNMFEPVRIGISSARLSPAATSSCPVSQPPVSCSSSSPRPHPPKCASTIYRIVMNPHVSIHPPVHSLNCRWTAAWTAAPNGRAAERATRVRPA